MKKIGILTGIVAVFAFAACNSSTDTTGNDTTVIKETETVVVPGENTHTDHVVVVPADAPAGTTVKTNPDGSQILVDKNGIEWRNKDGRNQTDIKISRDSQRIIIRK